MMLQENYGQPSGNTSFIPSNYQGPKLTNFTDLQHDAPRKGRETNSIRVQVWSGPALFAAVKCSS
jgi:hypothetical protein